MHLWFESKNTETFAFNKAKFLELSLRVKELEVPHDVNRKPDNLKEYKHWKGVLSMFSCS